MKVLEVETTIKAAKEIRMRVSLENQVRPTLPANGQKDEKN